MVKGGLWVFALRFINRGLGFIRTIVLARLLAPEDFGLLGIAMLAISTLETFSQTGFQIALIQKKENVKPYLDTAWTVSSIRGIILFLILLLSAPAIAAIFNSPQASLIIRVIAVSTLLSGFRNIGVLFFQKELEFNKQFSYEFSATLVDLTVAISLAFILRNVWALVWGGLAANFVRLIMSYIVHPYRPKIKFDKNKFDELFRFGRWTVGSGIFIFLLTQGDDIFIGKSLGIAALGFYQVAYMLSNLPASEVTYVISQVTLPAYSKLQSDIPRLKEAYFRVLQVALSLSFPIGALIFLLGPHFTIIFLGEKWMPMVPAMQALCIFGVTRSVNATFGSLFTGIVKPEIITKQAGIQLVIMCVLIYPLTIKWGILGTSIAVIIPNLYAYLSYSKKISHIINCKYSEFAKLFILPLLNISIMALLIIFAEFLLFDAKDVIAFLTLVFIGMISTIFFTFMLDKAFGFGFKQNLKSILEAL